MPLFARKSVNRRFAVVATLTLLASLFAMAGVQSASAAQCSKTYTASTTSQDTIAPGGTGNFTIRFTNTATNCTSVSIGSIKVVLPTGWTANSATPPSGWSAATSSTDATVPANEVWFRATSGTAKIANGTSRDFTINATAPSNATCGSNTVDTRAWVATDFTSSEFTPANASINVSCALLQFVNQPKVTVKGNPITDADNSTGNPVAVSASVDGSPVASLMITLTIGTNPSGGTLSPSPVSATTGQGGVATFLGISIDKSGEGYTLVASATGFSSVTSDPFDIVDTYVSCTGATDSCNGDANGGGTDGNIQTSPSANFLTVSILSPGLIDCSNYTEITGTVSWKTDDQGNQVGTITADSTLVKKLRPPDQGAAHFQVCFSPDPGKSFTDRSGNTVPRTVDQNGTTVTINAGLLPDCTSTITTNCVFFRNKTGAGSAVVQFLVADGKGRI